LENGHDQLSTWGLLKEYDKRAVGDWIDQLVDQGFLKRSEDEYPVLQVPPEGRRVLKGELTPQLLKPADRKKREAREQKAALASWEGVDRGLFEELRALRRRKADEKGLPPFIVFGDATLRDMARRRPSTPESLLMVHGIGERKSAQYGADFLKLIADYCQRSNLATDVGVPTAPRETRSAAEPRSGAGPRLVVEPQLAVERKPALAAVSGAKKQAFDLFAQGATPDAVAKATERSRSTVVGYLREYIEREGIIDPGQWLDRGTFKQICLAADEPGIEKLKPIFEALEGKVSYDDIGIALACLRNQAAQAE
jgi:ATP-dependent DNA helicase RecQ